VAKKFKINQQSNKKICEFINHEDLIEDKETFKTKFVEKIERDMKLLKDCAETQIVKCYINAAKNLMTYDFTDEWFDSVIKSARSAIANVYTNKTFDNNVDIYFNEVKKEYILNPQLGPTEIEFKPENYDLLVKQNLKLVVSCAKSFTGLGLPLEDLIQAGNVGLLTALEKYKPNNSKLKTNIINLINDSDLDEFTYDDCVKLIKKGFTYTKKLESTLSTLNKAGYESKEDFIQWADDNIQGATFTSAAMKWIRAYIQIELYKYGKIIKLPKDVIVEDEDDYSDNESTGRKFSIIRLDDVNNYTEDCYHDNDIAEIANEKFLLEDFEFENKEQNDMYKELVNSLLYNLDATSARIIKKRFGIDTIFELSISEIADQEGLSVNKVKYIINNGLKNIAKRIPESERKDLLRMFN